MKMLGNTPMGQRRRYLAEQEAFVAELFSKAEGFTTPITKPAPSFKAPASTGGAAKPKVASLKPTGNQLPSASQRLATLQQGLKDKIGSTAPGTGAPAAVGTIGKSAGDDAVSRIARYTASSASGSRKALTGGEPKSEFVARLRRAGRFQRQAGSTVAKSPRAVSPDDTMRPLHKREPLKTSISEDDARKLVDRHGLKGALPKNLDREQKMAAYEARYVSAGGKKAEKWDHRARIADKVKTGGLAVATAGGAGYLATKTKLGGRLVARAPKTKHTADTVAVAGGVAGGAGELYAAHARRKRSSYASAPAGVAASALRRMRDYTP